MAVERVFESVYYSNGDAETRQKIKHIRENLNRAAYRENPQHIDITLDYIYEVGKKQNWKCALSGLPLEFTRGGNWGMQNKLGTGACNPNSCSIDRINPAIGYVPGNVQLVTSIANLAKGNMNTQEFFEFCSQVHKFSKKQ